jgi:RNA polymerase sigma-70 factor (ECF subfamily)
MGNAALVAGVRAGNREALTELHERFSERLLRIIARVLGPDPELLDVHHDAFVRAVRSLRELRDPQALPRWMSSVAVHAARASIERRARRRRWVTLLSDDEVREPEARELRADADAREVLRATYAVLDRMGLDERTAFALRHIEGMELKEVAEACGKSLSTIKRLLSRAEQRFASLAWKSPVLAQYMQKDPRWKRP